jgi:hypothetical protein
MAGVKEDLMPTRRCVLLVLIAALLLPMGGVVHAKDDDENGWTRLGKVDFDDKVKQKEVVASILRGGWRQMKLKVADADAKIDGVTLVFSGGGRDMALEVKTDIKAGKESRPISLRGAERPLKKVRIKARSTEANAKTIIEVWLKDKD